jgi:hypothetical protein
MLAGRRLIPTAEQLGPPELAGAGENGPIVASLDAQAAGFSAHPNRCKRVGQTGAQHSRRYRRTETEGATGRSSPAYPRSSSRGKVRSIDSKASCPTPNVRKSKETAPIIKLATSTMVGMIKLLPCMNPNTMQ